MTQVRSTNAHTSDPTRSREMTITSRIVRGIGPAIGAVTACHPCKFVIEGFEFLSPVDRKAIFEADYQLLLPRLERSGDPT
jgi:hypothetical protein